MQRPQPREFREEVFEGLQQVLGPEYRLRRVDGAVTIEHNRARLFLAHVEEEDLDISVPVQAEFPDELDLEGRELREEAMKVLGDRLRRYEDRGYRLQEVDQQQGVETELYDEDRIPVVFANLCRRLRSPEELYEEVKWLVDQLPMS